MFKVQRLMANMSIMKRRRLERSSLRRKTPKKDYLTERLGQRRVMRRAALSRSGTASQCQTMIGKVRLALKAGMTKLYRRRMA
mgnify:CR=1 FL=1